MEGTILDRKDDTYNIIGAAMTVHKSLGYGFLEEVYQEALAIELDAQQIPFEREKDLHIYYRDVCLSKYYKADFVCYGDIIVELKATKEITNDHKAQTLNYLKATGYHLALLINFGTPSLQFQRLVR